MTKEYVLNGLSYSGCVGNVKQALLEVPNVQYVDVLLYPQTAFITMSKSINLNQLQSQLSRSGNYTIDEIALQNFT